MNIEHISADFSLVYIKGEKEPRKVIHREFIPSTTLNGYSTLRLYLEGSISSVVVSGELLFDD